MLMVVTPKLANVPAMNEILPLKVEDFYPDCFVWTGPDDDVHGLCLQVWGKVNNEWKYYWL